MSRTESLLKFSRRLLRDHRNNNLKNITYLEHLRILALDRSWRFDMNHVLKMLLAHRRYLELWWFSAIYFKNKVTFKQWRSKGGGVMGRSAPGGTFRRAAKLRLYLKSLSMQKIFWEWEILGRGYKRAVEERKIGNLH